MVKTDQKICPEVSLLKLASGLIFCPFKIQRFAPPVKYPMLNFLSAALKCGAGDVEKKSAFLKSKIHIQRYNQRLT